MNKVNQILAAKNREKYIKFPVQNDHTKLDYIIIGGQSNLAGRNLISDMPPIYGQLNNNIQAAIGSLVAWQAGISGLHDIGYNSWDSVFLYRLWNELRKTVFVAKYAVGSTSIGQTDCTGTGSWNASLPSCLLNTLKNRITIIKNYATSIGKTARCRAFLWDQKEGDENDLYIDDYIYQNGNTVAGNFVDMVDNIKAFVGDSFLPTFFVQQMGILSSDPNVGKMVNKQALYEKLKDDAVMLPMDKDFLRYPTQDGVHYSDTGTINAGNDMFELFKKRMNLNIWNTV